jgi:hypothetical protein
LHQTIVLHQCPFRVQWNFLLWHLHNPHWISNNYRNTFPFVIVPISEVVPIPACTIL